MRGFPLQSIDRNRVWLKSWKLGLYKKIYLNYFFRTYGGSLCCLWSSSWGRRNSWRSKIIDETSCISCEVRHEAEKIIVDLNITLCYVKLTSLSRAEQSKPGQSRMLLQQRRGSVGAVTELTHEKCYALLNVPNLLVYYVSSLAGRDERAWEMTMLPSCASV
jgi:hypothetical protein